MFGNAFSVNTNMLSDSRYAAENYMDKVIPANSNVLGIGHGKYLPRIEYRRFNLVESTKISEEISASEEYDYVITTSAFDPLKRFKPDSSNYKTYEKLLEGELPYELLSEIKSKPKWDFTRLGGASTNLDKINPSIKVYIRNSGDSAT
jgi:hypothetical protein